MKKVEIEKIEKIVETSVELPTLPSVATTLIDMVSSPNASVNDVGNLISEDPSLTARVLRVVNSAYYGFPQQITSISHSIIILGFNKVRDVVLTATILKSFKDLTDTFDAKAFWTHCITTAMACDALSRTLKLAKAEDVFVAGLLHDIGQLVLASHMPKEFSKAIELCIGRNMPLHKAERELMEFDHASVGSMLARKWSFTPDLTEAIQRHHNVTLARRNRIMAALVHVGDLLARSLLASTGPQLNLTPIDETAARELDLTRIRLDRAMGVLTEGVSNGEAFFEMIQAS